MTHPIRALGIREPWFDVLHLSTLALDPQKFVHPPVGYTVGVQLGFARNTCNAPTTIIMKHYRGSEEIWQSAFLISPLAGFNGHPALEFICHFLDFGADAIGIEPGHCVSFEANQPNLAEGEVTLVLIGDTF
jgi:hypothetical protein